MEDGTLAMEAEPRRLPNPAHHQGRVATGCGQRGNLAGVEAVFASILPILSLQDLRRLVWVGGLGASPWWHQIL